MRRIGFIGAGKVGASLGKYLKDSGAIISGYHDRLSDLSDFAARQTISTSCDTIADLLSISQIVFLTVPDDAIAATWEQCRPFIRKNMCVFHCSGALSSDVFVGSDDAEIGVGSLHPICAVNDNKSSDVFCGKFFVLEGNIKGLKTLKSLMAMAGNKYNVISKTDKSLYHAAAVASSNLVCALADMSETWLTSCGFTREEAHEMITPLLLNNVENIAAKGCVAALTGPVERDDMNTIEQHLAVLKADDREIYRLLSEHLVKIAQQKHPERNYNNLIRVLSK